MGQRAHPSGIQLSDRDASIVKGMLARGDRQHDIAAWFGVNGGRIGEIATGRKFRSVVADAGASPMLWVKSVFNSTVATGMPLRNKTRSMQFSLCSE